MSKPDGDGDFKKMFKPTCLKKKEIENSGCLSQMSSNDIFNLRSPEQLLLNIKVGLVFLAVAAF